MLPCCTANVKRKILLVLTYCKIPQLCGKIQNGSSNERDAHNHAFMYPRVSCRQLLPCYRPHMGVFAKEYLDFPTKAQANQQGSKLMLELQKVTKRTRKRYFCCCTIALWPMKRECWCTCIAFAGLGLDSRVESGCRHLGVRIWDEEGVAQGSDRHTFGDPYRGTRCVTALRDSQPSAIRPSCHMIPFRNVSDSCPHSGRSKRVTLLHS